MTRDEALDVMNILRFGTFEEIINTEEIVNKALDVAIEALRTEKICPVFSDNEVKQPCINCLECELERPHGEWIYHAEWYSDGECAFECSKCGMGVDVDCNFCPNCGADMRKEGDEK